MWCLSMRQAIKPLTQYELSEKIKYRLLNEIVLLKNNFSLDTVSTATSTSRIKMKNTLERFEGLENLGQSVFLAVSADVVNLTPRQWKLFARYCKKLSCCSSCRCRLPSNNESVFSFVVCSICVNFLLLEANAALWSARGTKHKHCAPPRESRQTIKSL